MKTEGLEKQTLTLLVFSANVIIGAIARQILTLSMAMWLLWFVFWC